MPGSALSALFSLTHMVFSRSFFRPLVVVSSLFVSSLPLHAELLTYEGFGYTAGTFIDGQTEGTGFATTGNFTAWTDEQAADLEDRRGTIQAGSLTFSNLTTSGNSLVDRSSTSTSQTSFAAAAMTRQLGTHLMPANETTQTDFWVGFLVRRDVNANSNGRNGFHLRLSTFATGASGGSAPKLYFGEPDSADATNPYALWVQAADLSTTTAVASSNAASPVVTSDIGRTDFLVMRLTFNAGASLGDGTFKERMQLFVNPTPGATAPLDSNAVAVLDTPMNVTELGLIDFGDFYGATKISFDELRGGTTYQDVAPVPEPSTLMFIDMAAILFAVRRNR